MAWLGEEIEIFSRDPHAVAAARSALDGFGHVMVEAMSEAGPVHVREAVIALQSIAAGRAPGEDPDTSKP